MKLLIQQSKQLELMQDIAEGCYESENEIPARELMRQVAKYDPAEAADIYFQHLKLEECSD